jgi:hypothetical protein
LPARETDLLTLAVVISEHLVDMRQLLADIQHHRSQPLVEKADLATLAILARQIEINSGFAGQIEAIGAGRLSLTIHP